MTFSLNRERPQDAVALQVKTARNDYLLDGELLTQMSSMALMLGTMGVLITPLF